MSSGYQSEPPFPQQIPGRQEFSLPPGAVPSSRLLPALVLLIFVLIGGFIAGIAALALGAIKATEPYKVGLNTALLNPQVQSDLGKPIKPGWFLSGDVSTSGSSGTADISVPLKGSAHSGTLYVVGEKSEGFWRYTRMEVMVDGEIKRINLLEEPGVNPDAPKR